MCAQIQNYLVNISPRRFLWKIKPWMVPQNLKSLWVYCNGEELSFELEIDGAIEIKSETDLHVKNSPFSKNPNFVAIQDPSIIQMIKKELPNYEVSGARGRGIIIGEIDFPVGAKTKKLTVLSTLKSWKSYLEDRTFEDV